MIMKSILFFLFSFLILERGFTQDIENLKIPATTSSKRALQYYDSSLVASHEGRIHHFDYFADLTLKEDSNFFMMNYYLALNSRWFRNGKLFKQYGTNAVNCPSILTPAEEILKSAMVKLLINPSENVSNLGQKVVDMYPNDIWAYYGLYLLQASCGDYQGQIKTIRNALKMNLDSAMLYDLLGYTYMGINKLDSAEAAFNRYIALAKYKPNAYDSKGNYYRRIKEYQKAFDCYMKGYSMDTTFKIPYNRAILLKKNILDTLKSSIK